MKESGTRVLLVGMVHFIMLMVMCIQDCGIIINAMDMEHILLRKVQDMRDTGKMIQDKDKVLRYGQKVESSWEHMKME